MSVTIKNIAKAVGVSPSTVSRVANGNTAISQKTRERILAAMAEMDYHPDSRARNLVNGNTNSIGLIMDARDERAFFNTFFDRSVYAIEKLMQSKGYTLLIANDDSSAKISPIKNLVLEKKVDGLLFSPSIVRQELIELLKEHNFPLVVLGEPDQLKDEICWVDADNEEGGRIAVRHLLEQGYENIALLVGSKKNVFVRNRIRGYKKGLTEAGMEFDKGMICECKTAEEAGKIAKKLLYGIEKPDAFLCSDNMIAWHVLQVLKQEKRKIPQEIGIVTFDNYPIAQYLDPPLTAIDVDTYGIGEQAARQLLQIVQHQGGVRQHTLMPTELLVRRSSKRRD